MASAPEIAFLIVFLSAMIILSIIGGRKLLRKYGFIKKLKKKKK